MRFPQLRWPLGGEGPRRFKHCGKEIPYTLLRRARKTIGLKIDQAGLTVAAPRWASLGAIEEVLAAKAPWIVAKLHEWQHTAKHRNAGLDAWLSQGCIPYLGRPHVLRFEDPKDCGSGDAPRSGLRVSVRIEQADSPHAAIVLRNLSADADRDTVCSVLKSWLERQARAHFAARIQAFSERMQLYPSSWKLSAAQSRWGSCNAKGVVRLHARLIHHRPEVIDYVVVHELAHLRELNHSPRFWALVESALPDYRERRALLRHHPGGEFMSSEDTHHANPAHHAQGGES